MIFWVALRKELLEQWRSYRLVVAVAVFVFFGLLSPLTAKLMPEVFKLLPNGEVLAKLIPAPTARDAVAQYIKNANQFAIILAVLMAMGAVAIEKDKGTAALMLVKPMPRGAFLAAKFAALSLTFVTSLALAGVACYYYTFLLFEALPLTGWLAVNGLLLLSTLLYVALTLLCSSLGKSQAMAGGLAFGLAILLAVLGTLPGVSQYTPGQLLAWAEALVLGGPASGWIALWVTAGLTLAALFGAWAIFARQEI